MEAKAGFQTECNSQLLSGKAGNPSGREAWLRKRKSIDPLIPDKGVHLEGAGKGCFYGTQFPGPTAGYEESLVVLPPLVIARGPPVRLPGDHAGRFPTHTFQQTAESRRSLDLMDHPKNITMQWHLTELQGCAVEIKISTADRHCAADCTNIGQYYDLQPLFTMDPMGAVTAGRDQGAIDQYAADQRLDYSGN